MKHYSSIADPTSELFNYTSGRWIYNEPQRLAERQLTFNIFQLNRIAAESVGHSDSGVSSTKKLAEGGFNRAFEITMRNGAQVVARLPYPLPKPKHYATASEAATVDFLRLHGAPVPRVLAYSTTNENPVGSEDIIMEKIRGRELGDLLYTMSEAQKFNIILEIVKIEARLISMNLPASGSIYYQHDLSSQEQNIALDATGGNGVFCIGPDAHHKWWHRERSQLSIERGPCKS